MKKMNLLVMSLVSAAALSFSSCSSNDDLTGGAGTQSQVKGFYMTLAVQTPTSNGTRTSINDVPKEDATAVEAAVKNGTFYLVDANGAVVFSKTLTGQDWTGAIKDKAGSQKDGKTTLQIQVENVAAGGIFQSWFNQYGYCRAVYYHNRYQKDRRVYSRWNHTDIHINSSFC